MATGKYLIDEVKKKKRNIGNTLTLQHTFMQL